jgi:hypothetical protein
MLGRASLFGGMDTATAQSAPARQIGRRQWAAIAGLLGLLVAGLISVIVLAKQASEPDAPSAAPPFAAPALKRPSIAYDVERADGNTLTVSGGAGGDRKNSIELSLPSNARVELLDRVAASELQPGDWLTAEGIPNEVKNFSIRMFIALPQPGRPTPDGVALTPGGFAGHEAARDRKELPILGGIVNSVTPPSAILRAAGGDVTVTFTASAPLRRLRAGTLAEIRSGDRIALHVGSDGQPDKSSVLVLVGGAN